MPKKILILLLIFILFLSLLACKKEKVSGITDSQTDVALSDTESDIIEIGWSSYKIDEKADIVYEDENSTVYELKPMDLYTYVSGADYFLLPTSDAGISESDLFIKGTVKNIREVISMPKEGEPNLTSMFLIADVYVSDILCSKSDAIEIGNIISIGFGFTSYTYDTELPLIQKDVEYLIALSDDENSFWADSADYVDYWAYFSYYFTSEKHDEKYIISKYFCDLDNAESAYEYFGFTAESDIALKTEIDKAIREGHKDSEILNSFMERCFGGYKGLYFVMNNNYIIDSLTLENYIKKENK